MTYDCNSDHRSNGNWTRERHFSAYILFAMIYDGFLAWQIRASFTFWRDDSRHQTNWKEGRKKNSNNLKTQLSNIHPPRLISGWAGRMHIHIQISGRQRWICWKQMTHLSYEPKLSFVYKYINVVNVVIIVNIVRAWLNRNDLKWATKKKQKFNTTIHNNWLEMLKPEIYHYY